MKKDADYWKLKWDIYKRIARDMIIYLKKNNKIKCWYINNIHIHPIVHLYHHPYHHYCEALYDRFDICENDSYIMIELLSIYISRILQNHHQIAQLKYDSF